MGADYNAEIRSQVAAEPRAIYVPFAETLQTRLPPTDVGKAFDASIVGFGGAIAEMFANTAVQRLPSGPSFEALARLRGRSAVHDGIHLTEASAACLAELVA